MLTSERIEEIQSRSRADYACLDAPGFRDSLAARRDVAALLTDRTELQAEIERLREQTQKWVKDWEVECQRYEAALGMTTSEHVALKDEIERLREQCVRWEAMYAGMTAERDGYWEECDSFKAEIERLRGLLSEWTDMDPLRYDTEYSCCPWCNFDYSSMKHEPDCAFVQARSACGISAALEARDE